MSSLTKYSGKLVEITYDRVRCIHARECVHGLPSVFDPEGRPWIHPDEVGPDEIADVVSRCPTGALKCRIGGVDAEREAAGNSVIVGENGPLYFRGDVVIQEPDGTERKEPRVALCRCGASAHKPFCDGSHVEAEFSAPGVVHGVSIGAAPRGPLVVTVRKNGPLLVQGSYVLHAGEPSERAGGALCRCGKSGNKPFCDGTHKKVGFEG